MMEDTEFYDFLYQGWSKTTVAGNGYWSVSEVEFDTDNNYDRTFDVVAATSDTEIPVGSFVSEDDAGFVAAIHGCLPDLLRKLGSLEDENARLDEKADTYIGLWSDALLEKAALKVKLVDAHKDLDNTNMLHGTEVADLKYEIETLEDELSSAYGGAEWA